MTQEITFHVEDTTEIKTSAPTPTADDLANEVTSEQEERRSGPPPLHSTGCLTRLGTRKCLKAIVVGAAVVFSVGVVAAGIWWVVEMTETSNDGDNDAVVKPTSNDGGTCDTPWKRHSSRCYRFRQQTDIDHLGSYSQAVYVCQSEKKSTLAFSSSKEDDAFLSSLLPQGSKEDMWLGITAGGYGTWTLIDGTKANHLNFDDNLECGFSKDAGGHEYTWHLVPGSVSERYPKCYLFVTGERSSLKDARRKCEAKNRYDAFLAVIKTQAEVKLFVDSNSHGAKYRFWARNESANYWYHSIDPRNGRFKETNENADLPFVCQKQPKCAALTSSSKGAWKRSFCSDKKQFACYRDIPKQPSLTSDPAVPEAGGKVVLTCSTSSQAPDLRYQFYEGSTKVQDKTSSTYDVKEAVQGVSYSCVASLSEEIHSEKSAPLNISFSPTPDATTKKAEGGDDEDDDTGGISTTVIVVGLCAMFVMWFGVYYFVIRKRKEAERENEVQIEGEAAQIKKPKNYRAGTSFVNSEEQSRVGRNNRRRRSSEVKRKITLKGSSTDQGSDWSDSTSTTGDSKTSLSTTRSSQSQSTVSPSASRSTISAIYGSGSDVKRKVRKAKSAVRRAKSAVRREKKAKKGSASSSSASSSSS